MFYSRLLLYFVFNWIFAVCLWADKQGSPAAPNILMIVSDDQGFGDFGCYGNELIKTPHLDQLFKESTRLYRFYVSPACSPTRASLMTGRYPSRTGVWDTWKGRENMRKTETTLAEILKEGGYATGLFGKWHLGENAPLRPQDQGFSETFLWTDISTRFDPGVEWNGEEIRMEGFLDDLIFDKAIEFLERKQDAPFFCYVASFLPHNFPGGKQVPEEEVEAYLHIDHLTRGDLEVYAMTTRMDRNIGRLLQRLDELGLSNSTLVVFLSDDGPQQRHHLDHGKETQRFNYGLRGVKTEVYEGGIRTPCFIRWPSQIEAGRDITSVTSVKDLFPTILDFVGISYEEDSIDGMSLVPILMSQEESLPDRLLFSQFQRAEVPKPWRNSAAWGSGLRWSMAMSCMT